MLKFIVTATRVFTGYEKWEHVVQVPAFIVEASSRKEALLKVDDILHTSLTETHVSMEKV